MVVNIDAVRYGAGFDAAGQWHDVEDDYPTPQTERERELIAPARGVVCGFLFSAILWVGLVAAIRGVLTLLR